jgi:hypothetical protein
MTCTTKTYCTYAAPVKYDTGEVVWPDEPDIWQLDAKYGNTRYPIGMCYPCELAMFKTHYEESAIACGNIPNSNNPRCKQMLPDVRSLKMLYCPGGDYSPLLCPAGSQANSDHSACVCLDGYYDSDPPNKVCDPCPAAHYCVNSVKTECADGTYQDKAAQPSCIACDLNGKSFYPCGANKLQAKCVTANDPTTLLYKSKVMCVPCNACYNSIITPSIISVKNKGYLSCYGADE